MGLFDGFTECKIGRFEMANKNKEILINVKIKKGRLPL